MTIAMVGLGKMGANMARRLLNGGHDLRVFDLNPDAVRELEADGATGIAKLADLADLSPPRVAWVMVPAGGPTESTVNDIAAIFKSGVCGGL